MYLGKSKKILEIVEELRGDRFNRLKEETTGLANGHKELSQEHKELSQEHDKLREELYKIYLIQETAKAEKARAGQTIPEESRLKDLVKIVYENHKQLMKQNAELQLEVKTLKAELQKYRDIENSMTNEMDFATYEMADDEEELEQ